MRMSRVQRCWNVLGRGFCGEVLLGGGEEGIRRLRGDGGRKEEVGLRGVARRLLGFGKPLGMVGGRKGGVEGG